MDVASVDTINLLFSQKQAIPTFDVACVDAIDLFLSTYSNFLHFVVCLLSMQVMSMPLGSSPFQIATYSNFSTLLSMQLTEMQLADSSPFSSETITASNLQVACKNSDLGFEEVRQFAGIGTRHSSMLASIRMPSRAW